SIKSNIFFCFTIPVHFNLKIAKKQHQVQKKEHVSEPDVFRCFHKLIQFRNAFYYFFNIILSDNESHWMDAVVNCSNNVIGTYTTSFSSWTSYVYFPTTPCLS